MPVPLTREAPGDGRRVRVIVPYQERLPVRKAHDVYVVRTCHAMAALGMDVHLLIGRGSPDANGLCAYYGLPPAPNLTVHRLPLVRGSRLGSWSGVFHAAAWVVARRLGAAAPSVLWPSTLKLARFFLSRMPGVPLVYDLHELSGAYSVTASGALRALEASVLTRADAVVTTTHALAGELARTHPTVRRTDVVPLATYVPAGFAPRPYPPGGPIRPRAFYIGQLYRLQGLSVALAAVARCPAVQLDVVGGGEEATRLREVAAALHVETRVRLHGFHAPAALPALLGEADWFLLPSLAEGRMPFVAHMKCYDYLAYYRPIVASDLPAVRELLADQASALLVPPGDSGALAEAMERLQKDPDLAVRLAEGAGEAGRAHTPERRATALARVFSEVCGQRR